MPTMPGTNADVFWGDPDKQPPNWRDHPIPDADEDDDSYSEDATPERRKWVANVLGFDPHENEEPDEDASLQQPGEQNTPESHSSE